MDLNFPILNNRTIISLDQFLTNPTGKGSSMMGKRAEIKKNLQARYYTLLQKHGGFRYVIYQDKDRYFFYFKIPSETIDALLYDVVLEFVPMTNDERSSSYIRDYSMNFFSNSPHMTYTYTYVLAKNKLLVELLRSTKYSKVALTTKPKVTNPIQIFGFEKSCYYAALYISEHQLDLKAKIAQNVTKITSLTRQDLLNNIMSQESKLKEYNAIKKKMSDEKRKAKEAKEADLEKDFGQYSSSIRGQVADREKREKNKLNMNVRKPLNMKMDMRVNKNLKQKATPATRLKTSSQFKSVFDKKKK